MLTSNAGTASDEDAVLWKVSDEGTTLWAGGHIRYTDRPWYPAYH